MRKKLSQILIILFLVIACSSAESVLGQMKRKKGHSQKRAVAANRAPVWEYRITDNLTPEQMNKLGADGWELAATYSTPDRLVLFFKRRKR